MNIIKMITHINRTILVNRKIEYIVFHWVGAVSTAKNNGSYFRETYRGASAHYFVDEVDVVQSVEEKDIAWSVGTTGAYYHPKARNANTISIEMCCIRDEKGNLTVSEAVEKRAIELARILMKEYGISIDNVLRHWDITRKLCPASHSNQNESRWVKLLTTLANNATVEILPKQPKIIRSGVIIPEVGLRVRAGAGTNHKQLDLLKKGTLVDILEISGFWGRIDKPIKGWIHLDYV